MRKIYAVLSIILSLTILAPVSALATEQSSDDRVEKDRMFGFEPDIEDRFTSDMNNSNRTYMSFNSTDINLRTNDTLPTSYNPFSEGYLTNAEQQFFGTCWLYSTTSAVENYVSYNYGRKFNISEPHANVALSKHINPHNYPYGYSYRDLGDGANPSLAFQYYTNWNSPLIYNDDYNWESTVSETSYPYSLLCESDFDIDENFTNAKSLFNVTGIKYISDDSNCIKSAILEYGSVITAMYYNLSGKYQNDNELAYYYSSEYTTQNHVAI